MFAFCCCTEQDPGQEVVDMSAAAVTEESPSVAKEEEAAAVVNTEEIAKPPGEQEELPATFEAVLERGSSSSTGLHFDLCDGISLYVCHVNEELGTPAQRYNETAPAGRKLKSGDFILEVNGVSGSAMKLAEEMKSSSKLTLKVHRPVLATHTVDKQGRSLGLEMLFAKRSTVVCIGRLLEGFVKESGADIRHGDRIIAVNGKGGVSSDELMDEMRRAATLELTISRCADVLAAYDQGFRPAANAMIDAPG